MWAETVWGHGMSSPMSSPQSWQLNAVPGANSSRFPRWAPWGQERKKTEMQIWQKWVRTLIFPLWLTKLRHSSKSSFKQEEKPTLKQWEEDNLLWIHAMKWFLCIESLWRRCKSRWVKWMNGSRQNPTTAQLNKSILTELGWPLTGSLVATSAWGRFFPFHSRCTPS